MRGTKDPVLLLTSLVLDISSEAKHDSIPLWRAQSHTAKVLLACSNVFMRCENAVEVEEVFKAHVRPLIVDLLAGITDEPEALLQDVVNNQDV